MNWKKKAPIPGWEDGAYDPTVAWRVRRFERKRPKNKGFWLVTGKRHLCDRLQVWTGLRKSRPQSDQLATEEFRRLARWLRGRDQAFWDEQLDHDSSAGKLDFLFDEADSESREGLLREWPALG